MEIKGIAARSFKNDVFPSAAQPLHGYGQFNRQLGIMRAKENPHVKLLTMK